MDTMSAFIMGQANRDKELMVFDWAKAVKLIEENPDSYFEAGLCGDWEYTGGAIWSNGKKIEEEDTYVYLTSTWAEPQIKIDGEYHDCYIMESDATWDINAYFPEIK